MMNILGATSKEMVQDTESAIAQIQTAVKIILQWQCIHDEEYPVDLSNVFDEKTIEMGSGDIIDLAEICECYGENFTDHINYINIGGSYCNWNKLLVTGNGEDIYILSDSDRIGTSQAVRVTIPDRDRISTHEYAAVNIKQLDMQSAWRVMQYLSMVTLECTNYWQIYEEV